MATSRIKTSSILQGFPKSRSLLAGNAAYDPAALFLIQRVSPTSGSSLTFNSIPQTYKHLQIRLIVRDGTNTNSQYYLTFNGGASASYASHVLRGNGTSALAAGFATNTEMRFAAQTIATTANIFGASIIDIHDYTSTTKNKTVRAFNGYDNNTSDGWIYLVSSVWLSTSAVTSITITNANGSTLASGSTFALYGMVG